MESAGKQNRTDTNILGQGTMALVHLSSLAGVDTEALAMKVPVLITVRVICALFLVKVLQHYHPDFYRSGVGSSTGGFRDDSRRGGFEEYDAGDDEDVQKKSTPSNTSTNRNKTTPPEPAPARAPVVDLLGGLEDDTLSSTTTATTNKALPAVNTKQTVGLDGTVLFCYSIYSLLIFP